MKLSQLFDRIATFIFIVAVLILILCNIFVYGYVFSRIFATNNHPSHASRPDTIAKVVPRVRPLIDTWSNIHVFLMFDYRISNPISVGKRYDAAWGALQSHLAAYRTGNTAMFLGYYVPFFRDSDASHDLAYWQTFHPDWVLYKCDRVTPVYEFGDPNISLNFTDPAVVSWQIQTYALPASRSGYDALAADNVDLENEFGACGSYINGKWVQLFTGHLHDPRWDNAVIGWLTQMQKALHRLSHPLALIPNISLTSAPEEQPGSSALQQVVSHIDGVLDESGFTFYGHGYITGTAWLQRIKFIEQVQALRKPYYIVNQFPSVGSQEIEWALASYLMGKEHEAALYISTIQGYGSDSWYSEYDAQIGFPVDTMYRKQNIYWRDYSHGLILVNSSATVSYTITLNASHHYMDLHSRDVSSTIQLSPHSGLVLLFTS